MSALKHNLSPLSLSGFVNLSSWEDGMPKKYQNPKLELRTDVRCPYWFIRVSEKRIDRATGKPKPFRVEKRLGLKADMTHKEAMKARGVELERVNSHRFVVAYHTRFSDLAIRFKESRLKTFAVPTQLQYTCQIDNHLVPAFGDLKISEVTRPKVEEFLAAKDAAGLGWWARKNLRSVLSAMYEAARDWKLWEGDKPTLRVRIGKKTFVREKRLLSADQFRRLLAELQPYLRFLVLVLFGLGLRISEALALKWCDLDFENQTLRIRRRWYRGDLSDETKTETSAAEIRMGPSMTAEFKRWYPGPHKLEEFLFLGDGKLPPDDRDLLRFEFRPVLKRLGLYYPGFGWHAFKRQSITWKQQIGGATPIEAQKAARHASLDMTYLYSLSDAERETAQQQKMFDYILGTAEATKQ